MKSGKDKKSRKQRRRLSRRDRAVLAHLAKYRLGWREVLHEKHFKDRQPGAVMSTLRRLLTGHKPLIRSEAFYGQRVYYQLTYAGTRAIDTSCHVAETLGHTTIIRQFALQSFLFLGKREERRLLEKKQLASLFEVKGKRLPQTHFYLATTGAEDKRLGCVVVDFGSESRRFANRIVQCVLRLLQHTNIRSMAKAGFFEVSVLTVSSTKRRSLYERLKVSKRSGGCMVLTSQSQHVRVRLFIHVVPGLIELIPDSRE